jgi:Memo-like protein
VQAGLQNMTTRPPAVAGQFYARDPDRLRTQVLDLLADVAASQNIIPKALIAPHAGYPYSGRVDAAAFATLRDSAQTITRVVLIGPAHYLHVHGIAAPTVDAFDTPLGRVPIDVEALRKIADMPFVIRADAPHAPEHALEVELPFLQTLLGSFQLVPLVVGDAAPRDVAHVLRQLWAGLETLIVVRPICPIIIATRPRGAWIPQPLPPLSGATGPVLAQTKLVAAYQSLACWWKPSAAVSRPGGSHCAIPETRRARATGSSDTELGCSRKRRREQGAEPPRAWGEFPS